jgi:hypothetical protein
MKAGLTQGREGAKLFYNIITVYDFERSISVNVADWRIIFFLAA